VNVNVNRSHTCKPNKQRKFVKPLSIIVGRMALRTDGGVFFSA